MASLPSPASWHRHSQQAESTTAQDTSSSIEAAPRSPVSLSQAPAQSSPESPNTIDQSYIHLTNSQTIPSPTESTTRPLVAHAGGEEESSEIRPALSRPPTVTRNSKPKALSRQNTLSEPKRCWICQLDSTEDEPDTVTIWRKPCPCSLEAHNDCLLQWIAAEEQPKKGELSTSKKIKCPQCGHLLRIKRPHDPIVSATEAITRASRRLILPTILGSVVGTTFSGLWLYGWTSMNCVFGVEEMQGILGYTLNEAAIRREPWVLSLSAFNPFILNRFATATAPANPVLLWFGLPAIAPALILMRTKLADQLFSMVLPAVGPYF